MTEAYADFLAYQQAKKTEDEVAYLAHYGVKGQKWGERKWQNSDGTYTEEGKHHYGWGYGRVPAGSNSGINSGYSARPRSAIVNGGPNQRRPRGAIRANSSKSQTSPERLSPQEIEARKARMRKILGIAAAVAVTAAVGYAAYKGSTRLRDSMRSDVLKNMTADSSKIHTLNSKFWDAADRKKYTEMTLKRANEISGSITRRDAVAAKLYNKTGIQIKVPRSRASVLAERTSANRYANFIRDAERRGSMNRSIHDARASLRKVQEEAARYRGTEHIGVSKRMEGYWNNRYNEQIQDARQRLNDLLLKRRAG